MKLFVLIVIAYTVTVTGLFVLIVSLDDIVIEELKSEKLGLQQDVIALNAKLEESRKYNKFQNALDKVSQQPYDREENNCYDHSQRLQAELADEGIESSIMVNNDRSHAWLAVWVESLRGTFIEPDRFSVLEVRDKDLKVICN